MEISDQQPLMRRVHGMATAEWGRMALPLRADDTLQLLTFPRGDFPVEVRHASPTDLQVCQAIGRADLDAPGLGELLLREHARWLFGRIELIDSEWLSVSHTVRCEDIDPALLRRTVIVVHMAATDVGTLLDSVDALRPDSDDEDVDDRGDR